MEEINIIPETIQLIKMSDEEYFSEKYKDYISNSKLSMFNAEEDGSPEKFEQGFENKYSESFELGSAVHNMILQPDFYFVSKLNKPTAKLGLFVDTVFSLRKKGYKIADAITEASIISDYYSGSLSATRLKTAIKKGIDYYINKIKLVEEIEGKVPIYLSNTSKEKLNQCILGITSNKTVFNTLFPKGLLSPPEIFNEYAILCEVDVTIDDVTTRIKVKGKLDNFVINHEDNEIILNDLKTTGKPVTFFMGNYVKSIDDNGNESDVWFNGSFQKFRYYRQMTMYMWLLNAAIKAKYGYVYALKANMVVVETIPNFKSKCFKVNGKHIEFGLKEFKRILIDFAKWKNQQLT